MAAAVVTQNRYRGRALVRAVFLIPYVLPSFVVATVWRTMLQPDGIVNTLLTKVGIDGGLWLSGPNVVLDADPGGDLGGLAVHLPDGAGRPAGVDDEVHEASALDGARWWPKLRHVILPYLRGPVCWPACWPR